jgi:hypothetical protein
MKSGMSDRRRCIAVQMTLSLQSKPKGMEPIGHPACKRVLAAYMFQQQKPAPRNEYAGDLSQGQGGLMNTTEDKGSHDDIEGVVGKRQILCIRATGCESDFSPD